MTIATEEDLVGTTVGRLTVIERVGTRGWRCRCSCGNERTFTEALLRARKSCGCAGRGGRQRVDNWPTPQRPKPKVENRDKTRVVRVVAVNEYVPARDRWCCLCDAPSNMVAIASDGVRTPFCLTHRVIATLPYIA